VQLLHDKGWSGARIARAITKSEGYVNNLIPRGRAASPSIMLRWRAEQSGSLDHVCATDWLVAVCLEPQTGKTWSCSAGRDAPACLAAAQPHT